MKIPKIFTHRKILSNRVKLIILYAFASLICIAAVSYFVSSYKGLRQSQEQLNEAQHIFEETNELVASLNKAQSLSSSYINKRNAGFLQEYNMEIEKSFHIIDTILTGLSTQNQDQLLILVDLLKQKTEILQKLSERKYFRQYLDTLRERSLRKVFRTKEKYKVESKVETDTVFQKDNRNFFQRLFSKNPKQTQIITIRQNDSVVHQQSILSLPNKTIDTLFQSIEYIQYRWLSSVEKQYAALILAEQEIGQEISVIQMDLHQMTLDKMLHTLSQKDKSIRRLLFAGILSFLIILGVVLIIYINAQNTLHRSRELAEAKRVTEELMNSRHQLLLSISHDIKAPLISILSYLEFWDKDNLSTDEIRQLSSMQNSAVHILDMLTNLLEYSRLEQKKTQIQNQIIEPIPLFLEIVDLFRLMAADKNLRLIYQFDGLDDVQVTIDPLKLRQIVTNLISNAIKYTVQGEVRLTASLEAEHLNITVSDTGIGIPKEKLDNMFESFTQSENRSAHTEGSGFGLFVVKGLVDVMNGKIDVVSTKKGSSFEIELPL
jgi:signal transduction histidine kinase